MHIGKKDNTNSWLPTGEDTTHITKLEQTGWGTPSQQVSSHSAGRSYAGCWVGWGLEVEKTSMVLSSTDPAC